MIGYIDTVKNFINEPTEKIINKLKINNKDANESQIQAWENLVTDLKASREFNQLTKNIIIALEYPLFVSNMSIDVLLCGLNSDNQKVAIMIEAKQWNNQYIETTDFSNYREENKELHPQVQLYRYVKAFKHYLNFKEKYLIYPCLYDKNLTKIGFEKLKNKNQDTLTTRIKGFDSLDNIIKNYKDKISIGTDEMKEELINVDYQPSRDIIQSMKDIITKQEGYILTEEQEEKMSEIIKFLKDNKKIIKINGPAGSGKSALLINLYIYLLNNMKEENQKVFFVSGAQNTNLYRSLYKEHDQLFSFSYSISRLIYQQKNNHYIIIMDEAQHNEEGIIQSLLQQNVTLILSYDEHQVITANNAISELKDLERRQDYYTVNLTQSVRFNNSEIFPKNIDILLEGKKDFLEDSNFEFKLLNNLKEVGDTTLKLIKENPDSTVAAIGLLTSNKDALEEINTNPNSIFFNNWGFKGECDWIPYIASKDYLNKFDGKIWLGTWWMPGLDVDYTVLIIGPDAKLTNTGIKGDPENMAEYNLVISIAEKLGFMNQVKVVKDYKYQKEIIDKPNTLKKILEYINREENQELKKEFHTYLDELISNLYYIMLTRARKGCYVYFMSDETSTMYETTSEVF